MEALKLFDQYWLQLKRFWVYAQYCAGRDMNVPACRNFWDWGLIVLVAAGILIAFFIFRKIIRVQIDYYRHRKMLAARAVVADEETMAQHKWSGDNHDTALSQQELAAEIRKATNINK